MRFYLTLKCILYHICDAVDFDCNLRKDHQTKCYERLAYESVDEKSLSWAMLRKNYENKNSRI